MLCCKITIIFKKLSAKFGPDIFNSNLDADFMKNWNKIASLAGAENAKLHVILIYTCVQFS